MASHIRTVLSLRLYDPAPEAMIFPSGCQLTLLTSSLCPDEVMKVVKRFREQCMGILWFERFINKRLHS